MVVRNGVEGGRIEAVDQDAVGRRLVAEAVQSTAALQSHALVGS